MAQIELKGIIQSISGRLYKNDRFTYVTRNGKTFTRSISKRRGKQKTDKQRLTHQEMFKKASQMTCEILQTTQLRAMYAARYKVAVGRKYATLRGFIMAEIYQSLKG